MMIINYLAAIVCLICWILVLLKMFPAEGVVKGILAIICGLYAFIWGWLNASKLNLRNVMVLWTIAIVVSIALSLMGSPIYSR